MPVNGRWDLTRRLNI